MQAFYTFRALLKRTLWGGDDIVALKQTADAPHHIGESWEVSGVPGEETVVVGGPDDGCTLSELILRYGEAFVGSANLRRYGTTFPLLVKFISASQHLSIQVHPDDVMARRLGHPFGKTEAWYIVSATPGSRLVSGFSRPFTAEQYDASLRNDTIMDAVRQHKTQAGQCYFIPAGRIHSIGAGNLLVEIQQSSDDTFRVYDFNRVDDLGRRRELHVEKAKDALNFTDCDTAPVSYDPSPGQPVTLVSCPQFTMRLTEADAPLMLDYSATDSFVVIVCFEGAMQLKSAGENLTLRAGTSVLMPAATNFIEVIPLENGTKFLDTFVQ